MAQDVAAQKGYTLAMTPKEFQDAIDNEKGVRKPSRVFLRWSCGTHTWWRSYDVMIKEDSKCPNCKTWRYESVMRKLMKQIFGLDFPQTQAKIVLNDMSLHGLMHFDGYCEFVYAGRKVKVAFEYQGYQHYKFPNTFHRTYKKFLDLQKNDKIKYDKCREQGIIFVVIPYKIHNNKRYYKQNIMNHIMKEFERQFSLIYSVPKFKFDRSQINSYNLYNFLGNP